MQYKIWYLLLICLIGCSGKDTGEETLSWMVKESGIKIPEGAVQVEYYPYMDYGKIFKFNLDSTNIGEFIQEYNLTPVSPDEIKMMLIENVEEHWNHPNNKLKKNGSFFYLSDCKPGLVWQILVNKNDNDLWFEMLHADYGGDEPECEK